MTPSRAAGKLAFYRFISLLEPLGWEEFAVSLAQKVEADLKNALKSRDELTTSCLRLVRAAFKNQEKEQKRPLNGDEEIKILSTLAKQRRDSIEQFTKGGRQDLADKEQAELAIIEAYLPTQLDPQAVAQVVDEVFAELKPQGMKDMGAVMKEAMARMAGQADGKLVNQLVRQKLQNS